MGGRSIEPLRANILAPETRSGLLFNRNGGNIDIAKLIYCRDTLPSRYWIYLQVYHILYGTLSRRLIKDHNDLLSNDSLFFIWIVFLGSTQIMFLKIGGEMVDLTAWTLTWIWCLVLIHGFLLKNILDFDILFLQGILFQLSTVVKWNKKTSDELQG